MQRNTKLLEYPTYKKEANEAIRPSTTNGHFLADGCSRQREEEKRDKDRGPFSTQREPFRFVSNTFHLRLFCSRAKHDEKKAGEVVHSRSVVRSWGCAPANKKLGRDPVGSCLVHSASSPYVKSRGFFFLVLVSVFRVTCLVEPFSEISSSISGASSSDDESTLYSVEDQHVSSDQGCIDDTYPVTEHLSQHLSPMSRRQRSHRQRSGHQRSRHLTIALQ